MSATKDWLMTLQDRPEYQDGWAARERGEIKHCFVLTGTARDAWMLGWDQANLDLQPRPGEP